MNTERENEFEKWQDAHTAKTEAECEYGRFAFDAGWRAREATAVERVDRYLRSQGIGGLRRSRIIGTIKGDYDG